MLLDGLEGDLRFFFSDPARCRLADEHLPDEIPQPKIMVESDEAWHEAVELLYRRGVVDAVETSSIPVVRGQRLLQGGFGAIKPGRFTADGKPVLRFIMDCRATNAVIIRLVDDLNRMPGATALLSLVVLEHEAVLFDAEDLVAAFYLLQLPAAWMPYFTFARPVDGSAIGREAGTLYFVASRVLPMGFSGATALLQH